MLDAATCSSVASDHVVVVVLVGVVIDDVSAGSDASVCGRTARGS